MPGCVSGLAKPKQDRTSGVSVDSGNGTGGGASVGAMSL